MPEEPAQPTPERTRPRRPGAHRAAEVAALLAKSPTLCVLEPQVCAHLAGDARELELSRGERLQPKGGAVLLTEGTATLLTIDPQDGEEHPVARLGRGDVCFDGQLFSPRGASEDGEVCLRADGPVTACRIRPAPLRAAAENDPDLDAVLSNLATAGTRAFLRKLATIIDLEPVAVRAVLRRLTPASFRAGDRLARAGRPGPGLSILCRGKVRREAPRGRGSPRLLACGDWFGAASLALRAEEAADVVAVSDGYVLRLEHPDPEHPEHPAASTPAVRRFLRNLVAALATQGRPLRADARPSADDEDEAAAADDDGDIDAGLLAPAPRTRLGRLLRRAVGRYPVRLQPDSTDCGPACLGMVADFHGRKLRHARLRELACVSAQGCSLLSLSDAAEAIGLLARGVACELDELRQVRLPAIALVGDNHFCVIYEATATDLLVADPATGLARTDRKTFGERWSGLLLLLRPTGDGDGGDTDGADRTTGLLRFARYLAPHRGVLAEVLLAAFCLQVLGLVMPLATQTLIDRVFVHAEVSLLFAIIGATVGATAFSTAIGALRSLLLYDAVRAADRALVSDFHHRLFKLPLKFFTSRKLGDILIRFSDNQKVRSFLLSLALGTVLDVVLGLVYLAVLLYYDVTLTLIGLLPIPALALITLLITPMLRRIQRELAVRAGDTHSALVESLTGIVTVKGACAEAHHRRRYEALFDRLLDSELAGVRLGTVTGALGSLIAAGGGALVLYFGAMRVLGGSLTVGAYIAFTALLSQVIGPALRLVGVWEGFQVTAVSLERLGDVLDAEPEEPHASKLLDLPPIEGHIRLDGVTFRYEKDLPPALDDVTLEVLPGERVAIVGRSGSGKTTLVHLLVKLYRPQEGAVLFDGHDLRTVSARSLRRQVGLVPQRIELFAGTITENIALGRDLDRGQVIAAARAAGAHDFIAHRPHGYETQVGEAGTTRFSGGELQRLAIARALVADPKLLVLDEPTSALDAESEGAFLRTLEETARCGRTVILLAHRLAFARRSDRIITLDAGRIVEQGTHDELLERGGLYAQLWKEQTGG